MDHVYVPTIAHLLRLPSRKTLHIPILPRLPLPWSAARRLQFSLLSGSGPDAQTARGSANERWKEFVGNVRLPLDISGKV